MSILLYIIIASFLITGCVWFSVLLLYFKKENIKKITLFLISLSAGVLMGGAFLHLLPEASLQMSIDKLFLITLIAFIFFFFMEKVLHWRHCHKGYCEVHTFGYMNLFGDALHNFIDGLIIGASYLISIPLGMTTTLAVLLHEIPQEIGDFGVLVYGGFKKSKALLINFLLALFSILGAIVSLLIGSKIVVFSAFLLPIAAGGFIYVAGSDLIPEMHKECDISISLFQLISLIAGILLMLALVLI